MKIISNDPVVPEKKIVLPLPEVTERGEVRIPEILGRKKDSHIDPISKHLIALDVIEGIPQNKVAQIHRTSQAAVSAISRGFNTTNIDTRKEDPDLSETINKRKSAIVDAATSRLLTSIENFDPCNLEDKQLPGAALKLATVVEKFTETNRDNASNTTFIIYQPRAKSEVDFGEPIDLNER